MPDAEHPIDYIRFGPHGWEPVQSGVIAEKPVALSVNGTPWLTFLCTPIQLEALGAGFLFNEGIVSSRQDLASVRMCCHDSNIDIWLRRSVQKPAEWRRTSGCAGGVTRDDTPAPARPVSSDWTVSPERVIRAMEQLLQAQQLYREVRGVHCSALSDGEQILARAEDIGRHNTLDKLAGLLLLEPSERPARLLLTTGRISSEMLQKSARLGTSLVVSRTSPSTLSIELAWDLGITLVGYARRTGFNVYSHPARLGYARQAVTVPGPSAPPPQNPAVY
jgi:FdhD protein